MAPRLSAKTTPKPGAPTREPTIGDNSRAMEEAERVQLISFVSKLSTAEDAIEAAKVPLKAAQKARSQIVGLAKAAGFTAKELERRLEEMRTPTRVMAETAVREHKHRRWLGILDADQSDLMLGDAAPEETKDEAHWKGEGYKAGLRQMDSKPPAECHTRFHQAYMKEHERGHLEVLTANAPKATPRSQAEQAAEDYAADNPEIDVAAAARKLKGDAAFMDRTAPGDPDEGFEATDEELSQQIGRPQPEEVV